MLPNCIYMKEGKLTIEQIKKDKEIIDNAPCISDMVYCNGKYYTKVDGGWEEYNPKPIHKCSYVQ